MTRVVGYVRVSTADQVDRESLPIQQINLQRYCAVRDLELVETLVEEGVSASKRQLGNRPAGRVLMEYLRQPNIDGVVIPSLDRLFRNTLEGLIFVERFGKRHAVTIYSLQEQIDTSTAHGRHILTILLANAQLESDRLSERASVITQGLREQGRQWGGVPFGCISVPGTKGESTVSMLYRDPETWAIRERIVADYAKGAEFSLRRIAAELEQRGIPTPGNGKHWHPQAVKRIVDNHNDLQHIPLLPCSHEAQPSGRAA